MVNIKVLLIPLLLIALNAYATDRYFSNTGNDAGAGTVGDPWLHPNNQTYSSGDAWYFNRGDVFDTVEVSISSITNVTFKAYGTGDLPKLTGAVEVNDFINESGNVYYSVRNSTFPRGTEIYSPNGITIDHVRQNCAGVDSLIQIARHFSNVNTITFRYLTVAAGSLEGGLIAVQPVKWQWNTVGISSNTSSTCVLGSNLGYSPYVNPANRYEELRFCALWNLPSLLDEHGEWSFNDDTLRVYSTSNPNDLNVRFTLSDVGLTLQNCQNAYIENIEFEQFNHKGIYTTSSTDLKVDSCKFNDISGYGIHTSSSDADTVINSSFVDVLNHSFFSYVPDRVLFQGNYVKRNAILRGLGNYTYGGSGNDGSAIKFQALTNGGEAVFQYNYFDSVGLGTQFFTANNNTDYRFQYNFIDNYGINRADNAGFYAASEVYSVGVYRIVKNNVFRGGESMGELLFKTIDHNTGDFLETIRSDNYPHAIYFDEDALFMQSDSNSVINCPGYAWAMNVRNRNSFNNSRVLRVGQDMGNSDWSAVWYNNQAVGSSTSSADRDTVRRNHIVVDEGDNKGVYMRHTTSARIGLGYDNNVFYFDYNKIAYPFGTDAIVGKYNVDYGTSSEYSLSQMQASGGGVSAIATDANTTLEMRNDYSGKSVSKENYAKMFINYSNEPHTFDLNGTYRDIDSTEVTTSLTVQPFYSEILFWQSGDTTDVSVKFDSTLVYYIPTPDTPVDPVVPSGKGNLPARSGTRYILYNGKLIKY